MSGTVRIDERLYLKIPVDRPDGKTLWVHAQAISVETFEQHWLVMAKTFAAIYDEGLALLAGPKTATRMLRTVAQRMNQWDTPGGVQTALLPEIRRLCNVLVPTPQGWQIVPFDEAAQKRLIDEDDEREIESYLVFFTVAWHLHRRTERQAVMALVASRLDASMSSQTLSALRNSLRTSTETASTGATLPTVSLQPSSIGAPGQVSAPASTIAPTSSAGDPPTSIASAIPFARAG